MRIPAILLISQFFLCGLSSYAQQTMGFYFNDSGSQDGYMLFSPMMPAVPTGMPPEKGTYLIDKCGKLVHEWTSAYAPGTSVYLLEDGTLLRPGDAGNNKFNLGGRGGIIERLAWNSNVLWSYTISDSLQCQHHDICHLPNGNILALVWEKKSVADAVAMGMNPSSIRTGLFSEKIVELSPVDSDKATIVWEWHVWDHLNQDFSPSAPNFDVVSDHPELVNINYLPFTAFPDWLHVNSIAYNATYDQILISVHNFSEIWVIDHSTTTAEAASHTGGRYHEGGDLLYRWGNPAAYNRGTAADQVFFGQHDAQWIADGLKDSGKIMVFNNGMDRPGIPYSSIDIINPPVDASGNYRYTPGIAYLPAAKDWSYTADTPATFYSVNISGCQRLANGNMLICVGTTGEFFEIDTNNKTVWKYINPVNSYGPMKQGTAPYLNTVFRCTLYESTYPGLAGKTLTPGDPIETDPLPYTCTIIKTGIETTLPSKAKITVVNPITDNIIVRAGASISNVSFTLNDVAGRTVGKWNKTHLAANQQTILNISAGLPAGMYILSALAPSQEKQFFKLIKE